MKKTVIVLFVSLFALVSAAEATNGYFSHGYGMRSKSAAGAGAAMGLSFLGSANNPAAITELGSGYEVSLAAFMPAREYTLEGEETVKSGSEFFLMPSLGASFIAGKNGVVNLSVYGNGGMNTDYPVNTYVPDPSTGIEAEETTGVDLAQIFTGLTYASAISPHHSVGVSAIFAYQRFKAEGVSAFAYSSAYPDSLNDNGYSSATGFGFKVGYRGALSRNISMGLYYQSRINMSGFDEYKGLFAEQGDFDIPASWTAGIAYKIGGRLTLLTDVQMIYYSDVSAIGNGMDPSRIFPMMPDMSPNPDFVPLGDDEGAGFGWDDMTVYKMGLIYNISERHELIAGYSYARQPVSEDQLLFNILAPGVVEHHLSMGWSVVTEGDNRIDISVTHAFKNEVTGPDPISAFMGLERDITIGMSQWDIGIGYSF